MPYYYSTKQEVENSKVSIPLTTNYIRPINLSDKTRLRIHNAVVPFPPIEYSAEVLDYSKVVKKAHAYIDNVTNKITASQKYQLSIRFRRTMHWLELKRSRFIHQFNLIEDDPVAKKYSYYDDVLKKWKQKNVFLREPQDTFHFSCAGSPLVSLTFKDNIITYINKNTQSGGRTRGSGYGTDFIFYKSNNGKKDMLDMETILTDPSKARRMDDWKFMTNESLNGILYFVTDDPSKDAIFDYDSVNQTVTTRKTGILPHTMIVTRPLYIYLSWYAFAWKGVMDLVHVKSYNGMLDKKGILESHAGAKWDVIRPKVEYILNNDSEALFQIDISAKGAINSVSKLDRSVIFDSFEERASDFDLYNLGFAEEKKISSRFNYTHSVACPITFNNNISAIKNQSYEEKTAPLDEGASSKTLFIYNDHANDTLVSVSNNKAPLLGITIAKRSLDKTLSVDWINLVEDGSLSGYLRQNSNTHLNLNIFDAGGRTLQSQLLDGKPFIKSLLINLQSRNRQKLMKSIKDADWLDRITILFHQDKSSLHETNPLTTYINDHATIRRLKQAVDRHKVYCFPKYVIFPTKMKEQPSMMIIKVEGWSFDQKTLVNQKQEPILAFIYLSKIDKFDELVKKDLYYSIKLDEDNELSTTEPIALYNADELASLKFYFLDENMKEIEFESAKKKPSISLDFKVLA